MTRLTFTYPLINAAQNVAFLIAGADKADMFAKVVDGTKDLHELPSSGIDPKNGRLFWFADSAAASRLKA
jgi:6-phosphogluconolactonase